MNCRVNRFGWITIILLLVIALAPNHAAPPELPDGTDKAKKAISTFRVPQGFKIELFAAEPMLASPVAFCIDDKGRLFVAEEYRFNLGTEENRTRPFLLEDDLQIKTLDDRLKMFKKHADKFEGGMKWFTKHADQLRLLEDTKGVGKADKSTVYATFGDTLDGLAAGVIAREDKVWVTCIPNLWLLKEAKEGGKAEKKDALLTGFGVNAAFLGHDLHGLAWGPDGRLYFSVGDRGFHVTTKEGKTVSGPRSGAVFRCDPDGSNLEVIHRGLRNPQELAFDQFGNLFADDNNCDKGDDARLVYVVEGGNSGWNMAYQTIPQPYLTGPWFAERMWHQHHPGQPAWIVPHVGKIGAGPSGFCFNSGSSMPDRYKNKFFMCNYTGNGGIESFGVDPKGAGFEIVDYHDFLKPIMATDVDFGYDGKMYVSDFVNLLWNGGSAGGRIYTIFDPEKIKSDHVVHMKKLFAGEFSWCSPSALIFLLEQPDMRVRLRAQYILAERSELAIELFTKTARTSKNQLARIHSIWGLWQLGRKKPDVLKPLAALLKDDDTEIRAQAARVIGDCRWPGAEKQLVEMLKDASLRVRYFAAMALGNLRYAEAIEPIADMLAANDDKDPFLRHAGVTALVRIDQSYRTLDLVKHESKAVQMALVLYFRHKQMRQITRYLEAEVTLANEAARAINDLPMDDQTTLLAKALTHWTKKPEPEAEPLIRRAINAHFRLGTKENADVLLQTALNANVSLTMRAEALACLRDWIEPPPRDRVTGFWRPLPKRDGAILRELVEASIGRLLSQTSGALQVAAIDLIRRSSAKVDDAAFEKILADSKQPVNLRIATLRLLEARHSKNLKAMIDLAAKDASEYLRAEGRDMLVDIGPAPALASIRELLSVPEPRIVEKQRAFATLAKIKNAEAADLLDAWAAQLGEGKIPNELQLDLLEVLNVHKSPKREVSIKKFEASLPKTPLGKFQTTLQGGNAERGREIFIGHSGAQCIRCHKAGELGGTAGPDLAKLVTRYPEKTREHLLESMILPNAKIAPGFGSLTVELSDGKNLAGVLMVEDTKTITVKTPDGKEVKIAKEDIEKRSTPTSAMPSIERTLTPREIRDLIEYLMTLK